MKMREIISSVIFVCILVIFVCALSIIDFFNSNPFLFFLIIFLLLILIDSLFFDDAFSLLDIFKPTCPYCEGHDGCPDCRCPDCPEMNDWRQSTCYTCKDNGTCKTCHGRGKIGSKKKYYK